MPVNTVTTTCATCKRTLTLNPVHAVKCCGVDYTYRMAPTGSARRDAKRWMRQMKRAVAVSASVKKEVSEAIASTIQGESDGRQD